MREAVLLRVRGRVIDRFRFPGNLLGVNRNNCVFGRGQARQFVVVQMNHALGVQNKSVYVGGGKITIIGDTDNQGAAAPRHHDLAGSGFMDDRQAERSFHLIHGLADSRE